MDAKREGERLRDIIHRYVDILFMNEIVELGNVIGNLVQDDDILEQALLVQNFSLNTD